LRARLGSVRVRTTALATLVVGLTLALGGVALVFALREALTNSVERAVRQQAAAAAELVSHGQTPGLLEGDADNGDDDTVAQILEPGGQVRASSPALRGEADDEAGDDQAEGDDAGSPGGATDAPPLAPGLEPGQTRIVHLPGDDDERYLAVAVEADTGETVVVAGTLEVVDESAEIVGFLLTLGLPLLLLIVAATTWRMVGRALAPVEAIRSTAEGVSATDLSGRVPTPTSADEVARLATTMNNMLDRLEDGQRRQRRFVADASHELRSPVATIRQHAEVARAHPDRSPPGELAETVVAEALRMQRLVDDLLLLARADEHSLGLRRRPLDLDDIVLDEVRRLRATTAVAVDAAGVSAGPVDGDADALRRAVRNVVDNAARHAAGRVALTLTSSAPVPGDEEDEEDEGSDHPPTGSVYGRSRSSEISRTQNGGGAGKVTLAVEDDGPGVPPDQRKRVFERFVRLDDARARDGGGSGLGLAIVAEVVAAHGGTVELTDAALGGARVEITLPART
jgi:signal transduction histidine kinase